LWLSISLASAPVGSEAPAAVSVQAWISTAGPYGEWWDLKIGPDGTAALGIGYMFNPLGKMSGEFHLTPSTLDPIRRVAVHERFMDLPPNISQDIVPLHAPDLRLTITIGEEAREVRVYDPDALQADPRVKRFLAVWNQVFAVVPLKPRWGGGRPTRR
jgi:hypothetical protein